MGATMLTGAVDKSHQTRLFHVVTQGSVERVKLLLTDVQRYMERARVCVCPWCSCSRTIPRRTPRDSQPELLWRRRRCKANTVPDSAVPERRLANWKTDRKTKKRLCQIKQEQTRHVAGYVKASFSEQHWSINQRKARIKTMINAAELNTKNKVSAVIK